MRGNKMWTQLTSASTRPYFPGILFVLALLVFSGCAAETVSRTSLNRDLLAQEKIRRVAVFPFENSIEDPMAGAHISQLFEMHLLQTGLYQIADKSTVEKTYKNWEPTRPPVMDLAVLRQLKEQAGVEGVILGVVSQYSRSNFGFTARLVSTNSGLVLWSVSQTAGRVMRPLSQVADEAVQASVKDLQVNLR
jgi:TolB-like protein